MNDFSKFGNALGSQAERVAKNRAERQAEQLMRRARDAFGNDPALRDLKVESTRTGLIISGRALIRRAFSQSQLRWFSDLLH